MDLSIVPIQEQLREEEQNGYSPVYPLPKDGNPVSILGFESRCNYFFKCFRSGKLQRNLAKQGLS
jgi:hypothetical protein